MSRQRHAVFPRERLPVVPARNCYAVRGQRVGIVRHSATATVARTEATHG